MIVFETDENTIVRECFLRKVGGMGQKAEVPNRSTFWVVQDEVRHVERITSSSQGRNNSLN